jgi:ATP-dependent helicase/nuclease subunit A
MAARLYRELGSWAVLEDGALAEKIEALRACEEAATC